MNQKGATKLQNLKSFVAPYHACLTYDSLLTPSSKVPSLIVHNATFYASPNASKNWLFFFFYATIFLLLCQSMGTVADAAFFI